MPAEKDAESYPLVSSVCVGFISCVSVMISVPSTIFSSVAVTPTVCAAFQLPVVKVSFVPTDPSMSMVTSVLGFVMSSTTTPSGAESSTTVYVGFVAPSNVVRVAFEMVTPTAACAACIQSAATSTEAQALAPRMVWCARHEAVRQGNARARGMWGGAGGGGDDQAAAVSDGPGTRL